MMGPQACSLGIFFTLMCSEINSGAFWHHIFRLLHQEPTHISTFDILSAQQYWMTGITGKDRVAFVAT